MPELDTSDRDSWLQAVYREAWRQYDHEETIAIARNALFVGFQAAAVAVLAVFASPILGLPSISVSGTEVQIGLGAMGVLLLLLSVLVLLVTNYWSSVTRAGQAYQNLRWITTRAIEHAVGLEHNLAGLEHEWRSWSAAHPGKTYYPLRPHPELGNHGIPPLPAIRGWASMLEVIRMVRIVWFALAAVGVLLIAIALQPLVSRIG